MSDINLPIGVVKFGPPADGKEAEKAESVWGQVSTADPKPQPPPTDRERFIAVAKEHLHEAQASLCSHFRGEAVDAGGALESIEKALVQLVRALEACDHEPVRVTIWPEEPGRRPRHYDLKEVPDAADFGAEPGSLYQAVPTKETE